MSYARKFEIIVDKKTQKPNAVFHEQSSEHKEVRMDEEALLKKMSDPNDRNKRLLEEAYFKILEMQQRMRNEHPPKK
jgi:hypothetical protein